MAYGPSYLSLNIHDFINVNFQNLLKRFKAGKFALCVCLSVHVKSHEPFPYFVSSYRHLVGGTVGFPKPAKAHPHVVLHAVQRHNSTSLATEGKHALIPVLTLGFTRVFELSCRIQSSFYPNLDMQNHCAP